MKNDVQNTHSVIDQVSWLMEHMETFLQRSFVENKSDLSMVREDLDSCCEDIFRRTVRVFVSFLSSHDKENEAFASLKASTVYMFRDSDRLYRAFHAFAAPFVAEKKAASLVLSQKELKTLDDRLAIHTARIQELKGIISKKGIHKINGEEMADLTEKFLQTKVLGMADELLACLGSSPKTNPSFKP